MMNPSTRVNLVTGCGTRGRAIPQGFENGRLRLADAGQQRVVHGAPRFQAERVAPDGNPYPAPLKLG
jgi:hypothetical protein